MRNFLFSAALVLGFTGCGNLDIADVDASQFDDVVPVPVDRSTGKPLLESQGRNAGLEARGPATAGISANTEVWSGTNRWYNVDAAAGMAWPADSGLTWDEKYAAWIDAMPSTIGDDGYTTVLILTPDGREVPSPRLECAEMGMFLRVLFAQWYDLPFFMTATHPTYGDMHFGHFGVVLDNGQRAPGMPSYATAYTDFSDQRGAGVGADAALAGRKLTAQADDYNLFLGENAYSGAYFDNLLANKRVGHFLHVLLTSFGSMHLAHAENTFNIEPAAMREGDLLVHRWQRQGIGHVMVLKEVDQIQTELSAQIMFGSMPRIQPAWYDEDQSRGYLLGDNGGSKEISGDGVSYAELGGGLKRWRTPVVKNGRWMNIIPVRDREIVVDGSDWEALGARVDELERLMGALTPEQALAGALGRIETARDNLRRRPASCTNRSRREDAFEEVYELLGAQGMTRLEIDQTYRILDDYVLAELDYDEAKTCCWNSTTPDMYAIIMDYTAEMQSEGTCIIPEVFKATDGGYGIFAEYAELTDRADLWVEWSEDETCPQRATVDDVVAHAEAIPYCELGLNGDAAPQSGCGSITYAGQCDGATLSWCNEDTVVVTECDATCGYDAANSYYNCL